MRVAWLLFCIYGLSFSNAYASTLVDLGDSTCSGTQSFDAGNGLSFSCSGNFSLNQGSLSSDTGIILSSLGSLTLDGFTLSAPSITLNAASIFLKSNASLTGHNINISASNPSANSIILDGQVILLDAPGGNSNPSTVSPGSITLNSGGNIGTGTDPGGIPLPPIGGISLGSGGGISIGSSGNISIIPLPASFTLLLTGLLSKVSLSGRSFTSKSR